MTEHQWTVVVVGACTMLGYSIGRILQRVEDARQKHVEFEARRWHGERRLFLVRPEPLPPKDAA
jgi:hypothetical protein